MRQSSSTMSLIEIFHNVICLQEQFKYLTAATKYCILSPYLYLFFKIVFFYVFTNELCNLVCGSGRITVKFWRTGESFTLSVNSWQRVMKCTWLWLLLSVHSQYFLSLSLNHREDVFLNRLQLFHQILTIMRHEQKMLVRFDRWISH